MKKNNNKLTKKIKKKKSQISHWLIIKQSDTNLTIKKSEKKVKLKKNINLKKKEKTKQS